MDANPAGFQNCVFGELLSDLQVLKVRVPDDAGCKPLPPQGKIFRMWEFSPSCGSLHWLGFMARLCLNYSLSILMCHICGNSSASCPTTPPAQENCSICSCKFSVSLGRSEFRILCITTLTGTLCLVSASTKPSMKWHSQCLLNEWIHKGISN